MKKTLTYAIVLAALLAMGLAAQADNVTLITSPMGGNVVDWSSIGLPVGTVSHGFVGYTTSGDTATATFDGSNTTHRGTIMQQGNGWNGNFANNEWLLWDTRSSQAPTAWSPITVSFSQSYNSLGGYIQTNYYGPFTAQIQVYHLSTLLGTFTENGNSTATPGTAIFIGAWDKTGPNITKIVFDVTAGNHPHDFAIGTLYAGTPEPSTMMLLGTGLLGLAGVVRRRMGR